MEVTGTANKGAARMDVSTIGLDIAKNVFQVHGVDGCGATVIQPSASDGRVSPWFEGLARLTRRGLTHRRPSTHSVVPFEHG